ncbi:MAG: CoA ester lyase [Magnetococcales bacterium]|nr:CoA ester lyase [Magnetococcales bacterium]MBF0323206.1 CoA ester lyase [Magnetococcales bacterium]
MSEIASPLLRSVLYVPGSNTKALAKAPGLGADALILDLEDSVAPEAKVAARGHTLEFLRQVDGKSLFRTVRINGIQTDLWRDDVTAVFPGSPEAITVPKVDRVEDLTDLDLLLGQLEKGRAPCPVWAMIESPLGVIHAHAIARHPRVACLVLGTSDLGEALGVESTPEREPLQYALQQVILAARAAGVAVIDGVFLNLKDPDGMVAQCRQGVRLGFDGKTVIHPSQVVVANQAFMPAPAAVERARRLVAAWQAARDQGEEICLLDGRLIERLHVRQAQRLLDLAERAAARPPS